MPVSRRAWCCAACNNRAVVREVAILHIRHGHRGLFVSAGAIAQALIGAEIKKFIGDYFSACCSPELIAFEWRFWTAWDARVDIGEEILRVQRAISQKVVNGSMELVGATFGDRVDLRGAA